MMKCPSVSSATSGVRPTSPVQFTVQGRIRFLNHGDRALDLKDPSQYRGYSSRRGEHPGSVLGTKSRCCKLGRVCSQATKSGNVSGEGHLLRDRDCGDDAIDGLDHDDGDTVGCYGGFDELSCFRGLVLDVSYRPINVVCWRRAICLEFMEKADVLEYYDQTVSSPGGSFYIPAVLRVPTLLRVVKRRRVKQHLSRKNIFFRDGFTCQYCSSRDNLTIDHVLPISRGGQWTWENLVTACAKCNSRKGKQTVEEAGMKLNRIPKAHKDFDIHAIPLTAAALKVLKMRKGFPDEWRQYLAQPSAEP